MLAQPRSAYVLYGIEPGLDFADTAGAFRALGDAQVIAFSHFACRSTLAVADVILPIALLPETDATLTNLDGRQQVAVAAGKPPGDARPGWRVLRALGGELAAPGFEFIDLAGLREGLQMREISPVAGNVPDTSGDGLEVAVSTAIYRSDAVIRRCPALQAHPLNLEPRVAIHPADAQALGLSDGDVASFNTAAGTSTLPVTVSDKIARGTAWIESGHGATAPLGANRVRAQRTSA